MTMVNKMTSTEACVINLQENPKQIALLEQGCEEIFQSAFPFSDDVITLDYMKDAFINGDGAKKYVYAVAGENLDTPAKAKVNAIALGIYFEKAHAGLLAYNAVREGVTGLGRVMVNQRLDAFEKLSRKQGSPLRSAWVEAYDPKKITYNAETGEGDSMDPYARLNILQHWGGEIIDLPYTQGILAPDVPKCDDLLLMSMPTLDGRRGNARDTIDFLHDMYSAEADIAPEDDFDFMRMKNNLVSATFNLQSLSGYVGSVNRTIGYRGGTIHNNDAYPMAHRRPVHAAHKFIRGL